MADKENTAILRMGVPFLEPLIPYVEPATAFTPISCHVVYNVYERLVELERDRTGQLHVVPSLAESWQVSDDLRVYSFKLRPDAWFASSKPVRPEDVKFSLERHVRYGGPPAKFLPLWEVRVTGNGTLDLVLREPSVTILAVLSTPIGSIIDPSVVPLGNDLGHSWLTTHSAGSGPFEIEHITDREAVLKANTNYWRGPPSLKQVILTDGPDPAEQRQGLERGELDISMGIAPEDFRQFRENPKFIAERVASWLLLRVMIRKGTKGPDGRLLTHSQKFTQAMKYALNYDAIAKLYGGWGNGVDPCQSVVPPGMLSYDRCLASYHTHDSEKARRLLSEAGYPGGLEVNVPYWEANWGGVDSRKIVEQVHADLRSAGISGELLKFTSANYYALPDGSAYGITVTPSAYQYPDPDELLRRRMCWPAGFAWPGGHPGYDFASQEKFVNAAGEANAVKRADLYKKLQKQYLEEAPEIYLLTFPYNVVRRSTLEGYSYPPNCSGPKFYGIAKD